METEDIKTLENTVLKKFEEVRDNLKKSQDAMGNAIEVEVKKYGNTLEAATADKIKSLGEEGRKLSDELKTEIGKLSSKLLDLEQKGASKPQPDNPDAMKTAGDLFTQSDAFKDMMTKQGKDPKRSDAVEVTRRSMWLSEHKAALFNATLNNDQPLVGATRLPGIIAPVNRRLMVRDLLPQLPTTSNVVEYVRELLFTNNAGPQGGGSSPAETEGQLKPESGLTFELANAIIKTIGHWIPVSKQVMSDAPFLAAYIDARLTYGLKLEEEDELLNSTGAAGELDGLMNQATAFAYGATNQSAIDTLLKAFLQVSLSQFEASGVVLHPYDWVSLQLLKDTTGRYLFSDPQAVGTPRIWGKDVVPTPSMVQGQFLTGAFDLAAAILDREGVSVRVSDQHADFFIRNMLAILCEERIGLAVFRPTAIVKGAISHAG